MNRDGIHLPATGDDDGGARVTYAPIVITDAMRAALWEQESRNWHQWHAEVSKQLEAKR